MLRRLKDNLAPILLTALLFLFIYQLSRNIPQEKAQQFIESAGPAAPVIFVLLTLLTYIFAPLSGSPLIFAGFYAFGTNVVFLTLIAAYLSNAINFWISRHWGRGLVLRFVGRENMKRVDSFTKSYGLLMLFFLRVFQGGTHDFVSYAAGLTSMRFLPYIVVSLLASVPGTALWYAVALKVETPAEFTLITLAIATLTSAIFILGSVIAKFVRQNRK